MAKGICAVQLDYLYLHEDIVTLIPRLPLSANSWALDVSKTRQSEFKIAEDTPSWMDRGVASHVILRRLPLSSNLATASNTTSS